MRVLKTDTKSKFGKWLRAERVTLGLTQREIASKLGCNPRTVGFWEMGKCEPSLRMAVQTKTLIKNLKQQSDLMNESPLQIIRDEVLPQFEPSAENGIPLDKSQQAATNTAEPEGDALCVVFYRLTELRRDGFDLLSKDSFRELRSYMQYLLSKQKSL